MKQSGMKVFGEPSGKGESYDAERRYAADQKNYAESVQ